MTSQVWRNKKTVTDALGVGKIEFVSCSSEVHDALVQDWMLNYEKDIPALLEDGIKVLIYAGEFDSICNWLGDGSYPSYLTILKPNL